MKRSTLYHPHRLFLTPLVTACSSSFSSEEPEESIHASFLHQESAAGSESINSSSQIAIACKSALRFFRDALRGMRHSDVQTA